jgi:hypothetical protein
LIHEQGSPFLRTWQDLGFHRMPSSQWRRKCVEHGKNGNRLPTDTALLCKTTVLETAVRFFGLP